MRLAPNFSPRAGVQSEPPTPSRRYRSIEGRGHAAQLPLTLPVGGEAFGFPSLEREGQRVRKISLHLLGSHPEEEEGRAGV